MDHIVWQKTGVGAQEPSHEFTAIAPNGVISVEFIASK